MRKRNPWGDAAKVALERGAVAPFPHLLPAELSGFSTSTEAGKSAPPRGGPSKTEERYRLEVLEPARLVGQVRRYTHQPPAYPLAHRCTLTVDFLVELADGTTEAVDVKGQHVWEDATIKLKFLARLRPDLRCVQVKRVSGGKWRRWVIPPFVDEEIPPRKKS